MPKDLTTKDVLYALEFLHDALTRQTNGKWSMLTTGLPVKPSVANAVRGCGSVFATEERDGRQSIRWKSAA